MKSCVHVATAVRVIVVMGVSGSGKSTIGKALAEELNWDFVDADDHHSAANREKLSRGQALNDADRVDWLNSLSQLIATRISKNTECVLACSALKEWHRATLSNGDRRVKFVHLHGSKELIARRLAARKGHFSSPLILDSQFEAFEPPKNCLKVEVEASVSEIVREIRSQLWQIS